MIKLSVDSYNTYINPVLQPVLDKGKEEIVNIKQKI